MSEDQERQKVTIGRRHGTGMTDKTGHKVLGGIEEDTQQRRRSGVGTKRQREVLPEEHQKEQVLKKEEQRGRKRPKLEA
jgi:hypothetical protein